MLWAMVECGMEEGGWRSETGEWEKSGSGRGIYGTALSGVVEGAALRSSRFWIYDTTGHYTAQSRDTREGRRARYKEKITDPDTNAQKEMRQIIASGGRGKRAYLNELGRWKYRWDSAQVVPPSPVGLFTGPDG